jgi:hypothetical protein
MAKAVIHQQDPTWERGLSGLLKLFAIDEAHSI